MRNEKLKKEGKEIQLIVREYYMFFKKAGYGYKTGACKQDLICPVC